MDLLKNPENNEFQPQIFKILHVLFEIKALDRLASPIKESFIAKKKIKPETLELIVSFFVDKQIRFNEKLGQKPEIFMTLLGFCEDDEVFVNFTAKLFEKLSALLIKPLDTMFFQFQAIKDSVFIERASALTSKTDYDNVFIEFYIKIFIFFLQKEQSIS